MPIHNLSEEHRSKLDGIVQQMVANGETEESIQFVVNDFKEKYGASEVKTTPSPDQTDAPVEVNPRAAQERAGELASENISSESKKVNYKTLDGEDVEVDLFQKPKKNKDGFEILSKEEIKRGKELKDVLDNSVELQQVKTNIDKVSASLPEITDKDIENSEKDEKGSPKIYQQRQAEVTQTALFKDKTINSEVIPRISKAVNESADLRAYVDEIKKTITPESTPADIKAANELINEKAQEIFTKTLHS